MRKSRHPKRQYYTPQGLPVVDDETIQYVMGNFIPEFRGATRERAEMLEKMIKEENPKLAKFMKQMISFCGDIKTKDRREYLLLINLLCYSIYQAMRHQAIKNAIRNTVYKDIESLIGLAATGDKDAAVVSRVFSSLFEKRPY